MSAVAKPSRASASADLREIERFLYLEARLLDEQRWHEWADLYVKDGEYWVPAAPNQPDPRNHLSLIYETDLLRAVRVKRYSHPTAFSLQPKPRSAHLVTNVMLDGVDETSGELIVNSRFIMIQYRRDEQRIYGGSYTHRLRSLDGGLKIALKKVDLVNCDAPLDNILICL